MKFLKSYILFESNIIFHKPTKTIFKPSFGGKYGKTDFYQILKDSRPVAEIEVLPVNKIGKPEILSLYVDPNYRGENFGKLLVDKIKEIYLKDEMYVLSTSDSKSFWLKMGAVESDDYLLKFVTTYEDSVKITNDTEHLVEYQFNDELGNKFLVQFKNVPIGKKTLSKKYTMSYFVWDKSIQNWSVTKMVGTNPLKVVATVLGHVMDDFLKRKFYLCNEVQFEGLAKENERHFITQRTKMYLRYLEQNPKPGFTYTNWGNNIITIRRNNK